MTYKDKEKIREQSKKYYLNNKEKIKEKNKQYHLDNKEKLLEQSKKYYLDNKEKRKEYAKQYRLSHKERKKEYNKEYWEKNKEKLIPQNRERYREYYKDPEIRKKLLKQAKKSRLKHRERILAYQAKYRTENKEEVNRKIKEWYYKNKDKVRARQKIYERIGAYRNSFNYKIKDNMRKRIMTALKKDGGKKTKRTMKLVGCTVEQLKQYIEKQFQPGMSWEQRSLWHIDHIIPCASFDLTKLSEQKKCFHYTNLQPLWAEDNLKKGAKLDYEKN